MILVTSIILAPLIAPPTSYSQPDPSFVEFSVGASSDFLGSNQGLGNYASYAFSFVLSPIEKVRIGLGLHFANPLTQYDLVGQTDGEAANLFACSALLDYSVFRFGTRAELQATTSIGFVSLSIKEKWISAGGFGWLIVPGRYERSLISSFGLRFSSELISRASAFVSPKLLLVSPMGVSSVGYSIGGGLSIGIF